MLFKLNSFVVTVILYIITVRGSVSSVAVDEDGYSVYTKSDYPSPMLDPKHCGRTIPGNLCSTERLLTARQVAKLDEIIRKIANDTGCICQLGCSDNQYGLSFGIALLRTAEKYSASYLTEFADYLREKWQLGECKNDVLILVVVRRGWITVSMGENAYNAIGRGFFNDLNDKVANDIKSGERDPDKLTEALETLTQSYYEHIKRLNLTPESVKSAIPSVILVIVIVFAAFIFLICCVGLICYLKRKCRKRKQEEEDAESNSIGRLKRGFGGSRDAYTLKTDTKNVCYDNANAKYIQCEKEAQSEVDRDAESSGQGSDASEDENEEVYSEDEQQSHRSLPTPSPLKSEASEIKSDKHG